MDWPHREKDKLDTLWAGLRKDRQTGYFMDWHMDRWAGY